MPRRIPFVWNRFWSSIGNECKIQRILDKKPSRPEGVFTNSLEINHFGKTHFSLERVKYWIPFTTINPPYAVTCLRGIRNSESFYNQEKIAVFVLCRDGGSEILNQALWMLSCDIVNAWRWLWNWTTDSFVSSFCRHFWPWPCTKHTFFEKITNRILRFNYAQIICKPVRSESKRLWRVTVNSV